MTEEQIQNVLELCHNAPVSRIFMLLSMYTDEDKQAMAKYLKCTCDDASIAAHLIIGK